MKNHEESSSDEEDPRLKEALDPHMFSNETTAVEKREPEDSKAGHYKDNILKVTPEFQSYVAKHLTDMLENTIEEYQPTETNIADELDGGIRLFGSSKEILTEENFNKNTQPITSNPRKRKHTLKRKSQDDISEKDKIRLAAVSPEWVLKKRGIRGWSKPKGKEIITKKNSKGELEIVNPSFVSC